MFIIEIARVLWLAKGGKNHKKLKLGVQLVLGVHSWDHEWQKTCESHGEKGNGLSWNVMQPWVAKILTGSISILHTQMKKLHYLSKEFR